MDSVYWYDPRKDFIRVYGRVKNGELIAKPITVVDNEGYMQWSNLSSEPSYEDIQLSQVPINIQGFNRPIILDIDLDAFLCTKDPVGQNPDILFQRLKATKNFIKSIGKKPTIISLARSQTPSTWVPPDKVNEIQNLTILMLNETL